MNDAAAAFHVSVARGAAAVLPPVTLTDAATGTSLVVAEILAYPGGVVVLRFVSGTFEGPFVPGYARTDAAVQPPAGFGLRRVDHINIASENLSVDVDYVTNALGKHQVCCVCAQLRCLCSLRCIRQQCHFDVGGPSASAHSRCHVLTRVCRRCPPACAPHESRTWTESGSAVQLRGCYQATPVISSESTAARVSDDTVCRPAQPRRL